MNRFLVLGFEYNNTIDYCLVRYKAKEDVNEYIITVMNGELEKLLFGNHVIVEKEGQLQIDFTGNDEQDNLKGQIVKALSELLGIPLQKNAAIE